MSHGVLFVSLPALTLWIFRVWHSSNREIVLKRKFSEGPETLRVGFNFADFKITYKEYPWTDLTSLRNDYLRTPTYDLDRAWRPVQIHSKSCLKTVERQQRDRHHHLIYNPRGPSRIHLLAVLHSTRSGIKACPRNISTISMIGAASNHDSEPHWNDTHCDGKRVDVLLRKYCLR